MHESPFLSSRIGATDHMHLNCVASYKFGLIFDIYLALGDYCLSVVKYSNDKEWLNFDVNQ